MDLSTTYMGLKLANPIVPSAGPLTAELGSIRQLEDAGAAAVVLHSLFEEQITHDNAELDHHMDHGVESFAESLSYFPPAADYHLGPDEYLKLIAASKEAVNIPVIASLNGNSVGGWIDYAKRAQEAGADALELNVYFTATNPKMSGPDVEGLYIQILKAVKAEVTIPVAMKIGPYFSSLPFMARKFEQAGADALVLFNRFYQPDIDLEQLEVVPHLVFSSSQEMRLPLRWIAILKGIVKTDFAATTGIKTAYDVLKLIMVGADVTQMCSVLLREGPAKITQVLEDLKIWMEEHEYDSITQMKGSMSQRSCSDPAAFERANYMKTLHSYV